MRKQARKPLPGNGGLAVEQWAVERLTANPRNYRKHPEKQIERLRASLRRHGFQKPLVVKRDGVILAGHGMELAARAEGMATVPVHVYTGEKPLAFMVDDNEASKGAEEDGARLEELVYEIAELEGVEVELVDSGNGREEPALEDPGADKPPAEPVTKPGDLWLCGRHRVLCGDATVATDVGRVLDGEKPLLCVTDPPYGVQYEPEWRDAVDKHGLLGNRPTQSTAKPQNDDRCDWGDVWSILTCEVLYCWHGGCHASEVQGGIEEAGFEIRNQIIWCKPQAVWGRGAYSWQHEPCWYAVRKGCKAHWISTTPQVTVWQIAGMAPFGRTRDDADERTGHSTQKPLECMARPIRNHGGDVIDPFLGSGTTLIAAHGLKRICYGIEIEPRYVDVAVRRWQKMTGQRATLESTGEPFPLEAEVAAHA
jgi:DNA modification methylase